MIHIVQLVSRSLTTNKIKSSHNNTREVMLSRIFNKWTLNDMGTERRRFPHCDSGKVILALVIVHEYPNSELYKTSHWKSKTPSYIGTSDVV